MAASRRLYAPRPVAVRDDEGPIPIPIAVEGLAVEAVREEWLVEDRWWTPRPLRRHYYELALADGRAVVVFHLDTGPRWFRQRA